MRTSICSILILLASAAAHAQAPAAPQVTLGADIKVLRFDWEPVPSASFYRLWVKPGGNTSYQVASERIPASITHTEIAIPVHLQDWIRTRYVVRACNVSGCRSSAALDPRGVMLDAIGYLKASNAEIFDGFGSSVALSDDGFTLAVSAPFEDSNASGVNGDQANNGRTDPGAVYVFRRRGNSWQQEAYLKASINQGGQRLGEEGLALSADGSILVASAPAEDAIGFTDVGAVYIFRRVQNVWRVMTRLDSPQPQTFDRFGLSPEISDDGLTLKVMSFMPYNRGGDFEPDLTEYRTHTYVRTGNTWQHFYTLAPFFFGDICRTTRLSGDGQTLVSACDVSPTEARMVTMKRTADSWVFASVMPIDFFARAFTLNPNATVMALAEFNIASVIGIYRWVGSDWVRQSAVAAPANLGGWGREFALGDNDRLLAVSSQTAAENGAGVSSVSMPGTQPQGAVYVYQYNDSSNSWSLRNVVKSPNPGVNDLFGGSIALSASGRTLAVGAVGEDSNATGIDGNRNDESLIESGAAYLY
jgi:hypothetical protein